MNRHYYESWRWPATPPESTWQEEVGVIVAQESKTRERGGLGCVLAFHKYKSVGDENNASRMLREMVNTVVHYYPDVDRKVIRARFLDLMKGTDAGIPAE